MSSMEFGANGSVVKGDSAGIDQIKRELDQREHAYPNGRTRSVAAFARYARIGLIFWCIQLALQAVMLAGFYFAPTRMPGVFYEIGGSESLNLAILSDWLIFATAITSFVLVGRFTYRAQKNLFTIHSPVAKMAPGWTVGWYFIPIAAIWQPAIGMSQIYRGSYAAVGEKVPEGSPIRIWWGAWLLMNVPDWFTTVWSDSAVMQYALLLASIGLSIVAAVFLMRILSEVAEKQDLLQRGGVANVFD